MSFVKDAVGAVGDFLVGSGPKERDVYGNMSQTEQDNVNQQNSQINNLSGQQTQAGANASAPGYSAQDQQFQDQFRNHLSQFLTSSSNGTNPTPEQMAQATNFVDQTFTKPTQNALNQYQGDFTDQQNAKAASLGRNPNADIATQQAIFGEGQRNTMNLQAQRAGQIQQTAQNLNNQDFQRQGAGIQGGLQGLQGQNSILSGNLQSSSFLNGLQQQAFTNQLNLLNQRSSLDDYLQRNRQQQSNMAPGQAGILPVATGIVGGASGLLGSIGGFGKQTGQM